MEDNKRKDEVVNSNQVAMKFVRETRDRHSK